MTKQELIEQGFKYIATQNCEQKTEVWAKFTGWEDMIQYWYYFPDTDQTNPGNVNTVSFVGQLGLFSIMQDKMRMDFLNKSVKYDKSCGVNTIYSLSHIMLMEFLKEMPVFIFDGEDIETIGNEESDLPLFFSSKGIKKYYSNTKELFEFRGIKKDETVKLLFSETLPDITELPIKTIYDSK